MATLLDRLTALTDRRRRSGFGKEGAVVGTVLGKDATRFPGEARAKGTPASLTGTGFGITHDGKEGYEKLGSTAALINQQYQAPPEVVAMRQLAFEQEQAEKRRPKGRQSTIQTPSVGLLGAPALSRRTLVGY